MLMKIASVRFAMLHLLILLAALPAAARDVSFSGRLLNGSRDSSGVAGQEIALQLFKLSGHAPFDVATTRSAGGGAFSFRIANPDTGAAYIASTEHQGVRYYSDQIHFAHTADGQTDIVLFDSTQSNRDITVPMHHLFIQDAGEALAVRETRVLQNPALKTILNAVADGHEHGAILRVELPPWAMNITPIAAQFGTDIHVHENVLYDTGVFEPGNRQVAFTYELPWQRNRATLVIQVDQPTRSLDLFLDNQGLRLEGAGLTDQGPFTIRGTSYNRYGIEGVNPGTRVQVQIIRETPAGEELPAWLIPSATIALLFFGFSLSRFFKSPAAGRLDPASREKLTRERGELITQIARLDAAAEIYSTPASQQERITLFTRLQAIERRLQSDSKSAKSDGKSVKSEAKNAKSKSRPGKK